MLKNMTVDGTRFDHRKLMILAVILLLMSTALAVCCSNMTDADPSYRLNKTSLTLYDGSGEQLTITPEPATSTVIEWESTNEDVATVSDGYVMGVGKGSATIKVTIGSTVLSCSVNVRLHVSSVTLDKKTLSLAPNETKTLVATVRPADAYDKSLTWTSNDSSIATVDSSGKVTGKAIGTTKITVVSVDDPFASDVCTVTVAAVKVSSVSINNPPTSIDVGGTVTLTATVLPSDATNKSVTWSSSNPNIISVTNTGTIKGIAAGSAVITVTTVDTTSAGNHCIAECTIESKIVPTTGVEFSTKSKTIEVDDEVTLNYEVKPSNASNKEVTWNSNNPKVATVSETGVVMGISPGKATITITTKNGSFKDNCEVTVDRTYTLTIRPSSDGSLTDEQLTQINNAVAAASTKNLDLNLELQSLSDTVKFPSSIVGKIMNEHGQLKLTTRIGSVIIPSSGLDSIVTSATTAGLKMTEATLPEKFSALNPAHVVDISMLAGDIEVPTVFAPTDVSIVISYVLASDEKAENLRVVYIDELLNEPLPAIWAGFEDNEVWFGSYHLSTYAYFFHDAQIGANSVLLFSCIFAVIMVVLTILIFLYVRSVDGFKGMFKLKQDNGQQRPPKYPPQQPPSYNNPYNYR